MRLIGWLASNRPKPVVHTITAIELVFRNRVSYYVSDCCVEQPDPFLMVTAPERPARKATNAMRCARCFTARFARSSKLSAPGANI